MTDFLTALSKTSLLFWTDEEPLSWSQVVALFFSLGALYALAQKGYAGDAPLIGPTGTLVVLQFVVAVALIVSGERLGPVTRFGPSLVRLLSIALVLGSAAIATNGLVPWVERLPRMPDPLGWRGSASVASGLLASVLLGIYTLRKRREGEALAWGRLALSWLATALVTAILVYVSVIPHSTTGS